MSKRPHSSTGIRLQSRSPPGPKPSSSPSRGTIELLVQYGEPVLNDTDLQQGDLRMAKEIGPGWNYKSAGINLCAKSKAKVHRLACKSLETSVQYLCVSQNEMFNTNLWILYDSLCLSIYQKKTWQVDEKHQRLRLDNAGRWVLALWIFDQPQGVVSRVDLNKGNTNCELCDCDD